MRLLITYLIVASAALALTHRFVQRLRPWAAVFVAFLPVVFLGEAFATNGVYAPLDIAYRWEPLASYKGRFGIGNQRTPLLVDVVDMHVPWRKAVRDAAKNGRWPLWNRFQLAGEPLLAVQMSEVLWPGGWLGFALPLAQAWTFDMALRIFVALLAAFLLLRDMDCSNVAACFGATAWALCDFLIFCLGYPLGPAAAALPLLVLGLRRIALTNGRDGRGVTVAATALILSAGHPETSLHAVAFGGVFFLVVLLQQPANMRARPLFQALVSGLLGVALMAITIVPFLEVLPHTFEYGIRSGYFSATRKSVPLIQSAVNIENQVVSYSLGVSGRSLVAEHHETSSYGGALILIFAVVGLCVPSKHRLALATVGVLGILIAIGLRGVADVAGKLPLFSIAINQRLVFVGAFSLAIFAGLGLDAVIRGNRWRLASGAAVGVGILIFGVWIERRPTMLSLKMTPRYMEWRLALELLPVLGVIAAASWRPARRLLMRHAWIVPLALAAFRYPETGRLYSVAPANSFYPPLEVLAPIARGQPQRFAAFGLNFIPNMAALYELEDVRGYEAMTLRRLVETFPLWCVSQGMWFNRIDDPTKPFLAFLNVRYFLVPVDYATPPGWRSVASGPGARLLENERVLARAFVPRRIYCDDNNDGQLATLKSIQDFGVEGVAGLGCATPQWRDNGRAVAQVQRYDANAMSVAVQAAAPTLVATSIPAWPGWQVHVDGDASQPIFYNHAFLGVQVPAGNHLVTLNYLPRGVLIGGLISGLAAVLLIAKSVFTARVSRSPTSR